MGISSNRYVNITSGVGAGAVVQTRELIARIFTNNNLLPPGTFLEFEDAASVADYFGGTATEEYLRANFYFNRISKSITRAQKISFARWVSAAVAPRIYGNIQTQTLGTWTAISAGSFGLTIGGVANTFTALDFSGATSLSDVAGILQTAIRTKTGVQWTSATVTYNSTRGSFDFVGGSAVAATISVQAGTAGTHIENTLGWFTGSTLILTSGSAVETLTDTLNASTTLSNNFFSYLFMPSLTLDQQVEIGTWNDGQNIKYMYSLSVSISDAATYQAALENFGGVAITIESASEYPEEAPMIIAASTDYDVANSVQNYMFQQFDLTPSVDNDADANTLDALNINYYGVTQTAGQFIAFYQRGVLMGGSTDPLSMNIFVNEAWLKDAMSAALFTLLLVVTKISANTQGLAQLTATSQSIIDLALLNGTISVGKILSTAQKLYIGEITKDTNAWYQVQNLGYWLNWVIVPVVVESVTTYEAQYTLVYSKDDVIRKIDGTHVII